MDPRKAEFIEAENPKVVGRGQDWGELGRC
jgi:hypothetical protein